MRVRVIYPFLLKLHVETNTHLPESHLESATKFNESVSYLTPQYLTRARTAFGQERWAEIRLPHVSASPTPVLNLPRLADPQAPPRTWLHPRPCLVRLATGGASYETTALPPACRSLVRRVFHYNRSRSVLKQGGYLDFLHIFNRLEFLDSRTCSECTPGQRCLSTRS